MVAGEAGFTLLGAAPTYGGVAQYAAGLEASGLFADVRIVVAEQTQGGINFQITASGPAETDETADALALSAARGEPSPGGVTSPTTPG